MTIVPEHAWTTDELHVLFDAVLAQRELRFADRHAAEQRIVAERFAGMQLHQESQYEHLRETFAIYQTSHREQAEAYKISQHDSFESYKSTQEAALEKAFSNLTNHLKSLNEWRQQNADERATLARREQIIALENMMEVRFVAMDQRVFKNETAISTLQGARDAASRALTYTLSAMVILIMLTSLVVTLVVTHR